MKASALFKSLSAAVVVFALPACTIKGTTQQTSDTIHNTTVTTSGRSWFTEDGLVQKGQEMNAFIALNFENVKRDMALGHGEYLASLSTLMGVPQDRHTDFYAWAQEHYTTLLPSDDTTPAQLLDALDHTLSAHAIPTETHVRE